MARRNLLLTTSILVLGASASFAGDATTTQDTSVIRTVNVTGEIETVTPWDPNWDDGVMQGRGTYVDNGSSSTTATSLNTSGTTATTVGNSTGRTNITGDNVELNTQNIFLSTNNMRRVVIGDTRTEVRNDLQVFGNSSTSILSESVYVGSNTTSSNISVGTGLASNTINMGNGEGATVITATANNSNVRLQTGTTSINTSTGNAHTNIGVAGNNTSILSTDVFIGNDTTSSNISVGTGSQSNTISVGTGLASNTINMGNGEGATVITATASNTAMAMQDDSITTTLSGDTAGVSAGTVIANNGSQRWIADDNGLLTQVNSADTTSGTTAAMVVTNDSGNTHGLVVQETKTTLSGGTNSASMTLDDRGATFSNPSNGAPIQVHGVADGTAPFDAVNVRQVYSGLAAVLAAAPDIRLEPGKTGFGVSLGSYGGYEAFGMGFGHMYQNGAVLSASVARGQHSKTAAKASIAWTW